ncbi:MAG: SDR family NAD(P)-dependent oxidoreductase [Elusimicrobia bacterium]|nr:SDR family NAD(P)-dependent oxidoreductase [Elusimicrobiota bacterium]
MTGHKPLRVLITGASSGLGAEMARQLAREGCRVAITGRRKEKLAKTAEVVRFNGGECLELVGDVTKLPLVKAHYATIENRWGGLDWAILNAGVGDSENARHFTAENYHWTFATNVGGVVNWIEAVLPDMLHAKSGVIAGVASLAGYRGLPHSGAYSASKAALISLLESTRVDLRGTGVDVVTVCPGFVKSEMTERNEKDQMIFLLETADGAKRIIDGIKARRRVVHFPLRLSLPTIYLLHNLPGFIYDWLASKVVKRSKKPYIDESHRHKHEG